jgi:hypothetical protein
LHLVLSFSRRRRRRTWRRSILSEGMKHDFEEGREALWIDMPVEERRLGKVGEVLMETEKKGRRNSGMMSA